MQLPILPSMQRRLVLSLTAGLIALLLASAPAAANEPLDWSQDELSGRSPQTLPDRVVPNPTPAATPTPTPTPTPEPGSVGYDISWPQCGKPYPESPAFAVVGVNAGRVMSENPCLGPGEHPSQLEWAGTDAELYFNTGNPGPRWSRYWPHGQAQPRECDTEASPGADTLDCAFVYGWNAAEHAYRTALDAFIDLDWAAEDADRLPGEITIWLDVEPANSWRGDRALNVAALEGAVAYLGSMEVDRIGFYSTPRLWDRITGGTDAFADHPAWHAGARDQADAERRCGDRAFTGGQLAMVQWIEDGVDANVRCE